MPHCVKSSFKESWRWDDAYRRALRGVWRRLESGKWFEWSRRVSRTFQGFDWYTLGNGYVVGPVSSCSVPHRQMRGPRLRQCQVLPHTYDLGRPFVDDYTDDRILDHRRNLQPTHHSEWCSIHSIQIGLPQDTFWTVSILERIFSLANTHPVSEYSAFDCFVLQIYRCMIYRYIILKLNQVQLLEWH